jgi:hypothetical protein
LQIVAADNCVLTVSSWEMDDANYDVIVLPSGTMLVICPALIRCIKPGLPINDDERQEADDCILVPRTTRDNEPIPALDDLNHISYLQMLKHNGNDHCVMMRMDGRVIAINRVSVALFDCLDDFTGNRKALDSISLECDTQAKAASIKTG